MATHSSALAWRIPGMGKPGGLPSVGSHRVGHDWSNLAAAAANISHGVHDQIFHQVYTYARNAELQKSLIPGWGTKIPHVTWHGQKKNKENDLLFVVLFCTFMITNRITFSYVSSVYSCFQPISELTCIILFDFKSSLYMLVINSLAFSTLKIFPLLWWLNPLTFFVYFKHTQKKVLNRGTLF